MKNKLLKLVEKNGFLLLLFICVCLVAGGTLYIATRGVQKSNKNLDNKDFVILEENKANGDVDLVDEKDGLDVNSEVVAEEQIPEVDQSIAKEDDEQQVDLGEDVKQVVGEDDLMDDVEEVNADTLEFVDEPPYVEEVFYSLPVVGAIMTEYTSDSLIYSTTLDEWRGHSGVDIKADIGSNVLSPLDGTIKEVYVDSLWGMVMVIDHGKGLESKFSNLGTLDMVRVGLNVKKGDIISKVGNSADIEMKMDNHIHIETRKDGKLVDPRSISN